MAYVKIIGVKMKAKWREKYGGGVSKWRSKRGKYGKTHGEKAKIIKIMAAGSWHGGASGNIAYPAARMATSARSGGERGVMNRRRR
jgi:hypothetical protein